MRNTQHSDGILKTTLSTMKSDLYVNNLIVLIVYTQYQYKIA